MNRMNITIESRHSVIGGYRSEWVNWGVFVDSVEKARAEICEWIGRFVEGDEAEIAELKTWAAELTTDDDDYLTVDSTIQSITVADHDVFEIRIRRDEESR